MSGFFGGGDLLRKGRNLQPPTVAPTVPEEPGFSRFNTPQTQPLYNNFSTSSSEKDVEILKNHFDSKFASLKQELLSSMPQLVTPKGGQVPKLTNFFEDTTNTALVQTIIIVGVIFLVLAIITMIVFMYYRSVKFLRNKKDI